MKFKDKLIKTVVLVLSLSMTKIVAVSAEDTVSLIFNSMEKKITVEGTLGTASNSLTTFTLLPDGVLPSDLSDAVHPNDFMITLTQSDGKYYLEMPLPSNLTSNKYNVYITNTSGSLDKSFLYASDPDIISVVKLINDENSYQNIANILEINSAKLATDATDMIPNSTNAAQILLSRRPEDGFSENEADAAQFLRIFNQSMAASMFMRSVNPLTVIEKYNLDIGLTPTDYNAYGADVCAKFNDLIKTAEFAGRDISDAIKQTRVLAYYKTSNNWSEVKSNVLGVNESNLECNDNFSILNPDTKYYSRITNKNGVFQKLYSNINNINTFSALKTKFYDYSKEIYDAEYTGEAGGSNFNSNEGSSGIILSGKDYVYVTPNEDKKSTDIFSDVQNHWAVEFINELTNAEIIHGFEDNTFRPNNNITRAEFVKLVVTAFDIKAGVSDKSFADVSQDDWFAKYVDIAVSKGIVRGVTDKAFEPYSPITRQDSCVMLSRYLGDSQEVSNITYADNDQISNYAKKAVSQMTAIGLINGIDDGNFAPLANLSRAEAATLIYRTMQYCK